MVVIVATIPPRPTLGRFHTIVRLCSSNVTALASLRDNGLVPVSSRIPNIVSNPPNTTNITETHRVLYSPSRGTAKLASSAPNVEGHPSAPTRTIPQPFPNIAAE